MELNFYDYLVENKSFVSLAFLAVLVPFFVTINNSYSNWKKSEQQENQSNLYKVDAKKDRVALLAKNDALNIEIKKSQSQTIEKANQVIALTKKSALVTIESQNRALERITAPYIQLDNIKVSDGILSIEIENIGPNPINHIAVGAYADSKLIFENESPKFHNNTNLPSSISLEEFFVKKPDAPQFEDRLTRSLKLGDKTNYEFSLFREGDIDVLKRSHGSDVKATFSIRLDLAIDHHELYIGESNSNKKYVVIEFSLDLNNLNVEGEYISISNRRPRFVFNTSRFLRSNGNGTATLIPPEPKSDSDQ